MNKNLEDHFEILRKIQKKPKTSQRELAKDLGFSLGKLNYCLKSLKDKGLVKINNFKKKRNKVKYFQQYVITPKGIAVRTKLTINFYEAKMAEYDELKQELYQNNFSIKFYLNLIFFYKNFQKILIFL